MTHVRAHCRADGTYVRAHTRRSRPRHGTTNAAPRRTASVRPSTVRSIPVPAGPTTRVRSYRRADGTYVRSHDRALSRSTVVATGSGLGGLLLLLLVLVALSAGGGQGAPKGRSGPSSPAALSPGIGPGHSR
ncbi:hypothetical protein [Streptomyces sp. NPDC002785]|uniref:hypothetical protein n=1 Tax=Streptomyces sp. NPDC002785 TaxID=3154543 RepID=UPI00331F6FFE